MIPKEIIDDIRRRARIESVISQFINVIKKGNNYVAVCPFHDDHSPSLQINADKQIFKCFSCPPENGSAGDVFTFVMKYNQCDYITAVKTVAEMIGYKYDFGTQKNVSTFEETPIHRVLNDACLFTQHELLASSGIAAKAYLDKRHITKEQIEKFQLGYNPSNDVLYNFLHLKGYSDADIVNANLARLTNGGMRDVFYNRLMIPISDHNGHVIGFTARSMEEHPDVKYINTSDTPVFKKGDFLYNYHRAAKSAREKKFMIIAEGPMDVFAFDKVGFSNAVCSLGTNCTQSQLNSLKKLTNRLVLAFDGDRAGQDAIYKVGKLALDSDFEISILYNTTKLDPDEIINQISENELVKMVENSISWIEFMFRYVSGRLNLDNYENKKKFAGIMADEINKIKDSFDRDFYMTKLSEMTDFSKEMIKENFIKEEEKSHKEEQYVSPPKKRKTIGRKILLEKTIIQQMILSVDAAAIYKKDLNYLPDEIYKILAAYILEYYSEKSNLVVSEFISNLEDNEMRSLAYDIMNEEILPKEINIDMFNDYITEVKTFQIESDKQEKKKEANSYNDPEMQARAGQEYVDMTEKQKELRSNNKEERGK